MWTTIAEVANAARLTATVAPDRIIADQASFPIRMWKGFQIVLVISSYFNEIGRIFGELCASLQVGMPDSTLCLNPRSVKKLEIQGR